MRENTLFSPRAKEIEERHKRQRIEAALALTLFVAIAVIILAGISFANGNAKALIFIAAAVLASIPALIYVNRQEEKA